MELKLERPLIFFDLETTGTNITKDRIVELSYVKVYPDGHEETKSRRINPEMPIPPASTAVHHITDEDVKDAPTFRQVAKALSQILADSDIAGYNSNKFDVPLLIEEFNRVGLSFDLEGRQFIDVQNIFHKMEQRTLVAAYRFYCGGEDFDNAHTAEADTLATYAVLKGQLDKYGDALKNDVNTLSSFGNKKSIDFAGSLIQGDDGDAVINFGKFKGKKARDVYNTERSYFSWIQNGAFMLDTKKQFAKLEQEFAMEKLKTKWGK